MRMVDMDPANAENLAEMFGRRVSRAPEHKIEAYCTVRKTCSLFL